MAEVRDSHQAPVGWVTRRTKDGKKTLRVAFYATNRRYIEVHNDWQWEPIYDPQEVFKGMKSQ